MVLEAEEFSHVYPILMNEIHHIERVRGKLNDFQLMLAVSRAKDSMGILGWERRQTVNAILEKYAHIYREFGREEADEWVQNTFGFMLPADSYDTELKEEAEPGLEGQEQLDAEAADEHQQLHEEIGEADSSVRLHIQEISHLIAVKESELLQLYREFYRLSGLIEGRG